MLDHSLVHNITWIGLDQHLCTRLFHETFLSIAKLCKRKLWVVNSRYHEYNLLEQYISPIRTLSESLLLP